MGDLGDAGGEGRCDPGVDGVAATHKHAHPRLGGEMPARGDHAKLAHDLRSVGRGALYLLLGTDDRSEGQRNEGGRGRDEQ